MTRWLLVIFAVLVLGLIELPPLLARPRQPRELPAVISLLVLSLVSGLYIVAQPEGASLAKVLFYWVAPLGEALLGPL